MIKMDILFDYFGAQIKNIQDVQNYISMMGPTSGPRRPRGGRELDQE
jgi:hypothetical protein